MAKHKENNSARRLELMPLGELTGADVNPKRHAQADLGKSIGRFGYVEPCVLDERTQRLVAGHGRVQALRVAKQRGDAPPEGVEDRGGFWWVPVLRGWSSRSDAEAQSYLLASNQLTTAGGWDTEALADLLKSLEVQDALEGTGFSPKDVEAMVAGALAPAVVDGKTNADAEWEGMPEFDNPEKTFRRLVVNFESQADVDDFARLLGQRLTDKTRSVWHPYKPPRDLDSMRYLDEDAPRLED
jgi:hypothetical protein